MKVNRATRSFTPIIQVFRKIDGAWCVGAFNPHPGDAVGGTVDGIDLSTPYTLIDQRPALRADVNVLLADDQARILTRSLNRDQADPQRKELESKAKRLEVSR
jgi:hypothetical protein